MSLPGNSEKTLDGKKSDISRGGRQTEQRNNSQCNLD